MTVEPSAGPQSTPEQARAAALRTVDRMRHREGEAHRHLEIAIGTAIALGCSLRQVAEQAGVAHTTVQRIADRLLAAEAASR